tara:strand:- start:10 stop:405 length:396 start_codon:yes stop_codon:yes gene_type:complete
MDITISKFVVGFIDRNDRYWFDLFTKPGFRHCLIFGYNKKINKWISFDWTKIGTEITILNNDEYIYVKSEAKKQLGATFIEIKKIQTMYSNWSWIPMYCVSVIKSILGIKKPFIITPYQLYCALNKIGKRV